MNKSNEKKKKDITNKQNAVLPRVRCFNTKGYFDPSLPFDSQYIEAKLEVFLKYRVKQTPISVFNAMATDKQRQQQKQMIIHHCKRSHSDLPKQKIQNNNKFYGLGLTQITNNPQKQHQKNAFPLRRDNLINHIRKVYLQKKQRSTIQDNKRNKIAPSIACRINTEALSLRRYSQSSKSLSRNLQSRLTNLLRIEDQNDLLEFK